MFAPGWHHKWLVLAVLLGWVFLNRFRLLGLALGRLLTLQLALDREAAPLQIAVRVERVTLQPLRVERVELSSGDRWRVAFSSVTLRSFVREFFRSFGQVRILALEVDGVQATLGPLDDVYVDVLLRGSARRTAAAPSSPSASSSAKASPLAFFRFVDVLVADVQIQTQHLGIASSLQCRDVYVGITDVFTSLGRVQLSARVSALTMTSQPTASTATGEPAQPGAWLRLPGASARCDFDLGSLRMLGCVLKGCPEQELHVGCDTNFVEMLARAHNDLVQRGVVAGHAPRRNASTHGNTPARLVPRLELADLWLRVRVSSRDELSHASNVEVSAEIHRLVMDEKRELEAATDNVASVLAGGEPGRERAQDAGVCVVAHVRRVQALLGDDPSDHLVDISSINVHVQQSGGSRRRRVVADIDECVLRMSPRAEANVCGLLAALDRINAVQRRHAGLDTANDNGLSLEEQLNGEAASGVDALDVELRAQTWTAGFEVYAKGDDNRRTLLDLKGSDCTLRSAIQRGEVSSARHDISVRSIQAKVAFSSSSSDAASAHRATFTDVEVATTKTTQRSLHTRDASLLAKFSEVTVNEYSERLETHGSQAPGLPAACFRNLVIKRDDHMSSDVTEVLMDVQVDEVGVLWSHRRHVEFLEPILKLESAVESIDRMLSLESSKQRARSPTRRGSSVGNEPEEVPQVTSISLAPRRSTIRLTDIADIADCVTLALMDTKLRHKKTHLDLTTAFECAFTRVSWSKAAAPAVEVSALVFTQRAVLGRQRFMVQTPSQSSISMASMKVFMYPGRKLLALLLQLDALSNSDAEPRPDSRMTSKSRATAQSMTIDCAQMMIEVHYRERSTRQPRSSLSTAAVRPGDGGTRSFLIELSTFNIKLTKSSLSESSDAVARFIQKLQGSPGCDLSARSFAELVQKAVAMEGVATAQSMVLVRRKPVRRLAECQGVEVHFALTDVTWQRLVDFGEESGMTIAEEPLRTLIFDASVFSESILANVERRELEDSFHALQTIQESLDTRIRPSCNSDSLDTESPIDAREKANFRFRFAGNVDVGVHKWTTDFPYGGDSVSRSCPLNPAGTNSEKVMRVVINEFVLSTRQFQKLSLQFDSMAMYLLSREIPSPIDLLNDEIEDMEAAIDDCVRLAFLPAICANAMLHWQDEWVRPELPQPPAPQYFSVSVDIGLRQHPALCAWPSGAVPSMNEALLSLNWDYAYPWLICMVTDDEETTGASLHAAAVETEGGESTRAVCCNGIQWDMSLGTVQAVWWDGMTQEQGIMLVAGEFVSHGIALHSDCAPSPSKPSVSTDSTGAPNRWRVVDLTLYLDRLHGYLLHESAATHSPVKSATAGTGDNLADEEDAIPFDRVGNSEFFWEMMGTSYRLVATSDAESGSKDDSLRSLFGDPGSPASEKMHDGFVPIDYGFSLNAATKMRKLDSLARSQATHLSALASSSSASSSNLSPPPSPRAGKNWSHTIRSRLSRLKRRTASMDNLLLNDGSCPIQVDSMKLLWTLETRDAVFYMVAVLVDSLQLLQDALDQCRLLQQATDMPFATGVLDSSPQPTLPAKEDDGAATRPPEAVRTNSAPVETKKDLDGVDAAAALPSLRIGRRGSTRDTLLDLLMQGKLGMKSGSDAVPDEEGKQPPPSATKADSDQEDVDTEEIAIKQYTVDIHDVQINMRDDNSRSSVLVAADRIHLEVGLDALRTKSVVKLTFDVVTGHVAPVDVDIAAPVLWYSNAAGVGAGTGSRRYSVSSSSSSAAPSVSSSLLKQVLEECSLSSTYTQARASGASTIDADLSFLQVTADRHQFYQMLYVLRHVLLAPPATAIRGRTRRGQSAGPRTSQADGAANPQAVDASDTPASSTPTGAPSKKLYAQMVEELRARELKTLNTSGRAAPNAVAFKSIAFRALGLQMRLRLSPEVAGADYEFVEIRAEGLTGSHTYYVNQCTKFVLNLQWMEITNLRPGQSSIAFDDAMSVLRAKLLVNERPHHPAGVASAPKSMLESFSSPLLASNQKGMLSVRAESGPVVRVLGQKLRVLDVLEVSMFPEVSNMIVIQLAADFYDLVYKFFFAQTLAPEASGDLTSEQLLFGRKVSNAGGTSGTGSSGSTTSASCSTPTASSSSSLSSSSGMLSSPSIRSRLQAPSLLVSASNRRRSIQASSSASSASSTGSGLSSIDPSGSSSAEACDDDDNGASSEADGCELFYFKYVRFGNVRLRINCNGFFVNLNNFDLDLPPFVCQSRLYTGQKLLQKFESHLKWYVTKESASSGLSQFKNRLLKWTPSGSLSLPSSMNGSSGGAAGNDKKDRAKRQESEDTAALNAQVLFGPYSGAAT